MPNKKNMLNLRFTRLVVTTITPSIKGVAYWICSCDCGNIIHAQGRHLRSGNIKSCGCLHKERMSKLGKIKGGSNKTHNKSNTDEYKIWAGIKRRCNNIKDKSYPIYGDRGIKVCSEWSNSFLTFLKDMGKRPSNKHHIHRVDNNGVYSKDNCMWKNGSEHISEHRKSNIKT